MRKVKKTVLYVVLLFLAFFMMAPFYMMFVMSTLSTNEIYSFPPHLIFGSNLLQNFKNMMKQIDLLKAFLNSCIVTFSSTFLSLLFCSMGGYAFATYEFPGKKKLFALLLTTMMIPFTAGIIPWFLMMANLKWINTYWALIVPGCANAFGIFWMKQYCQNNIPVSLREAARIDGCSEWTVFFKVIAPILVPAYSALGIMQFVNTWNDFMQPLMILRKPSMLTLPLALKTMVSDRGNDYGAIMLASTCGPAATGCIFMCIEIFYVRSDRRSSKRINTKQEKWSNKNRVGLLK